ncbi:DUF1150 family protein [Poseidonocella sedimentorum]|uniref:DUF1150 family protein n=1 Tax=Poseidonocella sedimentorum TaxID=871652 RepID=A0A1I6E8F3_9RHOB|nr:DUF1150 family protein [Poseidonocella sedimentorum]SFR14009.1 hypothetical protein SAMN04515673_10862 [Poseidonocella sedimentorum]
MQTPIDIIKDEGSRIVYVREVELDDLPAGVRHQIEDVTKLYAVHSESGERLAIVTDRDAAFMLARHHDLAPVPVH